MLRVLQRALFLPLIPALFFLPILCCCFSSLSYAKNLDQFASPVSQTVGSSHCEQHNPQDSHPRQGHECSCPKLQGTLVKNFDLLRSAAVASPLANRDTLVAQYFFSIILDARLWRYDHSPPQLSSKPQALYLKYSVLRI